MAGAGAIQSLGEIARSFSQSFLAARQGKQQQAAQEQEKKFQHLNALSSMFDRIPETRPQEKEALRYQIEQLSNEVFADKPTKKPKPSGAGSFISRLFGMNKPEAAAQPKEPADIVASTLGKPPEPTAPAPTMPGSQTFGGLGEMFGQELEDRRPVGRSPLAAAQTQALGHEPPALPKPPAMAEPSAGTPPAAPAVAPAARTPGNFRTPQQLVSEGLKSTETPRYGYTDPTKAKAAASAQAQEAIDEFMGQMDAMLERTPTQETMDQALAIPGAGPLLRAGMDAILKYEAAGLIAKGTLEQWQSAAFPTDPRFGYKVPEPAKVLTLEDKVNQNTANTEERKQWVANLIQKATAGKELTPRETAYKASYDAKIARGLKPEQAYSELEKETTPAAPQQPARSLQAIDRNGRKELAWITQGQAPEFTGQFQRNDFNLSSLMTSRQAMVKDPKSGAEYPMGTTNEWDPAKIITAHRNRDIEAGTVNLILGEIHDPVAKQTLQDYVDGKIDPFKPPKPPGQ